VKSEQEIRAEADNAREKIKEYDASGHESLRKGWIRRLSVLLWVLGDD